MRTLLPLPLMLVCGALSAAKPAWQFAFQKPEVEQAFWQEFQQKVVGSAPAVDFDIKMEITAREPKDGYTFCTVYYNVEKDERIKGYLLIPDHNPGEKLPLVFCLHPTFREGKDVMINCHSRPAKNAAEQQKWDNRANALELVKRGYICFLPDRYGYGDRGNPELNDAIKSMRWAEAEFAKRHPAWHKTFGKVPYDLSRALDGLLKFDFVDADRIGTEGHSLGGWDSLYFWGSDPRVRAAVVNSGGAHWIIRQLWLEPKWRTAFLDRKFAVTPNTDVCSQIFMMHGAPRPLLYMRGLKDIGTDYAQTPSENARMIREYFAHCGGKGNFAVFFHDEGHDFPEYGRALAWKWLDTKLKPSLK